MELEGEMSVEGRSVDLLVGLENVRCEIATMRTPDGHGRIELDKFHTPAVIRSEPKHTSVNTLGLHRIMFAVDDIENVLARLRTHGAELVGEVTQYEDICTGSVTFAALRALSSHSPSNSSKAFPHGRRWNSSCRQASGTWVRKQRYTGV